MTTLTQTQQDFVHLKLRTVLNRSTGIRGITYDSFTGYFTVRDEKNDFVDAFGDLPEAIECLLCCVHGFRSVEPDVVDAVIYYLDADKFLK